MNGLCPQRRRLIATLALPALGIVLVLAWQSVSGESHQAARAATYQLRSEFPLGPERSQEVLRQMARIQRDLESALNLQCSPLPIQVNLFQSRESFLKFLQPAIPAASERTAVYVQGRDDAQIYVCHHGEFESDVRHECTHAVLHQSLKSIPLWLDEGIAEYFEEIPEGRADGNSHLAELRKKISQGWAPNLGHLEGLENVGELTADHYCESWGWVHFLMHGPAPARDELQEYLQVLRTGTPAGRLSSRLRSRMPDMDVQLINHLRDW